MEWLMAMDHPKPSPPDPSGAPSGGGPVSPAWAHAASAGPSSSDDNAATFWGANQAEIEREGERGRKRERVRGRGERGRERANAGSMSKVISCKPL